jgi:hypothetical protein
MDEPYRYNLYNTIQNVKVRHLISENIELIIVDSLQSLPNNYVEDIRFRECTLKIMKIGSSLMNLVKDICS